MTIVEGGASFDKRITVLYNIYGMPELDPKPTVPDELEPLLDDEMVENAHQFWQSITIPELRRIMPGITTTPYGRAAVIEPVGEWDETTIVVGAPFQQVWKPTIFARMGYAQLAICPTSRMVVLPNNSVASINIDVPLEKREVVASGDLRPFYEQQARVLEALGTSGAVMLSGYSLGALTAIGLAAVCSDKYKVEVVNADEPPTGGREHKELRRDFLDSGGWADQRAAIADSQLQLFSKLLNRPRLVIDYAEFGAASFDPFSQALSNGMARQDFSELVKSARNQWPDIPFKIGHVAGSKLVRVEQIPSDVAHVRSYSGDGTHMHATGDNVVAHALMMLDALSVE
jgi:hypothetical protein